MAPLFLFFCSRFVLCNDLLTDGLDLVVADVIITLFCFIIVTVKMEEVLRLYVVLITHAEGRCPCRDALKLILKHVSPSVALDGEQYLPPPHLIQIFVARYADLAYARFERFVGVCPFFRFPPSAVGFISLGIVAGTKSHSVRISTTACTSFTTSSRVA